jgi:hypothetical protein
MISYVGLETKKKTSNNPHVRQTINLCHTNYKYYDINYFNYINYTLTVKW